MTLGQKIEAKRLERGLTQKELADRCALSNVSIHEFERGKKVPREVTLREIARQLRCKPDELRADKE